MRSYFLAFFLIGLSGCATQNSTLNKDPAVARDVATETSSLEEQFKEICLQYPIVKKDEGVKPRPGEITREFIEITDNDSVVNYRCDFDNLRLNELVFQIKLNSRLKSICHQPRITDRPGYPPNQELKGAMLQADYPVGSLSLWCN